MANEHLTPGLTLSKSLSFSFHALIGASITPARFSCESGYRRHLPPDISELFSRCYQRITQFSALHFPPILRSTVDKCGGRSGVFPSIAIRPARVAGPTQLPVHTHRQAGAT